MQCPKLQHAQTCGCSRYASWSCALSEFDAWPCRFSEVSEHLLLCHTICIALTLVQHIDGCARICPVSFSSYVNIVSSVANSSVHQDTLIACPIEYGAVQTSTGAMLNLILIVSACVNPCVGACVTASLHVSVGVSRHASVRHCMCQCMCHSACVTHSTYL